MKVTYSVSIDAALLETLRAHVKTLKGRNKASLSGWIVAACEERLEKDTGKNPAVIVDCIGKSKRACGPRGGSSRS